MSHPGDRIDVFPSEVNSDPLVRLEMPESMKSAEFFRLKCVAFTCHISKFNNRVRYVRDDERRPNVLNNFNYTLKGARQATDVPKRLDNLVWEKLHNRYTRHVNENDEYDRNRRSKICVTMSFRWDSRFLVKAWFTFGLRIVERGECHVVQTHGAGLLYYELKEGQRVPNVRTFQRAERDRFNGYALGPNGIFRIEEGSSYLLVTYKMSLFTIDRFRTEAAPRETAVLYEHPLHDNAQMTRSRSTAPQRPFKKEQSVMPLDVVTRWSRKKRNDETTPPRISPTTFSSIGTETDENVYLLYPFETEGPLVFQDPITGKTCRWVMEAMDTESKELELQSRVDEVFRELKRDLCEGEFQEPCTSASSIPWVEPGECVVPQPNPDAGEWVVLPMTQDPWEGQETLPPSAELEQSTEEFFRRFQNFYNDHLNF